MTEPLFLGDLDSPRVGEEVVLTGDEGRHAADVRRVKPGEVVLISDGAGMAIRGPVTAVAKASVSVRVEDILRCEKPDVRYIVVQALAKGERAELAVEVLTEAGVDRIIPWQAERSVVKWSPDRVERGLTRWRAAAREAAKQSRRFRVPVVTAPMTTAELALRLPQVALALVLHEKATEPLALVDVPAKGEVVFVVGPEGGLTDEEVATFTQAGGKPVLISDGVLRTSTAGVVALAQVQALQRRARG